MHAVPVACAACPGRGLAMACARLDTAALQPHELSWAMAGQAAHADAAYCARSRGSRI